MRQNADGYLLGLDNNYTATYYRFFQSRVELYNDLMYRCWKFSYIRWGF